MGLFGRGRESVPPHPRREPRIDLPLSLESLERVFRDAVGVVIIFQKMPQDIRLFSLLFLISRTADSLSLLQILFLIIMGDK